MLAAMGSQLSHSRNCLQLKGAALPTLLPLPRGSLHPMPDWSGVQGKSEGSPWLQTFPWDWMRHLCDWTAAQIFSVQSTFPHPFTGIIPKGLPKSTFGIHTSMSDSATQGAWPKTAPPLRQYMIWNLKDDKEPAMHRAREKTKTKSLKQGENFWISRKRKKANIAVCPNSYTQRGVESGFKLGLVWHWSLCSFCQIMSLPQLRWVFVVWNISLLF